MNSVLESEQAALASEMMQYLPNSDKYELACGAIASYLVNQEGNLPLEYHDVSVSDIQQVLQLLDGQVLNSRSLANRTKLYVDSPLALGEVVVEDVWRSRDGKMAIKRLEMYDNTAIELALPELVLMCSLKHPNLLRATGFHFSDGYVYLYLDWHSDTLHSLIYAHTSYLDSSTSWESVWLDGNESSLRVIDLPTRRQLGRELFCALVAYD